MTDPDDPTSYQARERALIEQLAVTVIADPKSTDEERASARSRLQGGGETAPDANRLTSPELVVWSALSRKLHGAFTTPTHVDAWIDREYTLACQALAAAARGDVVHPVATPEPGAPMTLAEMVELATLRRRRGLPVGAVDLMIAERVREGHRAE